MIHEDHSVEMSRLLVKLFAQESSHNFEICKIPQLKFIMFQIGCHYSRLFWLIEKFDISKSFNQFAIGQWREVWDKLRRAKDSEFLMTNKVDFIVFSIRWLFQSADTLIRLGEYEDVEEVYNEVGDICTRNIPDYNCFQKILHCRKENLSFMIEQGKEKQEPERLSFEGFLKARKMKSGKAALKTPPTTAATSQVDELIYVDSSDYELSKVSKKPTKHVKKAEATSKPSTSKAATSKPPTNKAKPERTPKPSKAETVGLTKDTPAPKTRSHRHML